MSIVVVGGSAKDVGKTALVCGVIAALPEFGWTAVKIRGHDYLAADSEGTDSGHFKPTVWEETTAGYGTDTGRYLAAGARRALLVTRLGPEAPIAEIRRALAGDRNVIFESNRIVDVVKPDVCLALLSDRAERKQSFLRLLRVADAVVSAGRSQIAEMPTRIRRFELESPEHISAEMETWLRERLNAPSINQEKDFFRA